MNITLKELSEAFATASRSVEQEEAYRKEITNLKLLLEIKEKVVEKAKIALRMEATYKEEILKLKTAFDFTKSPEGNEIKKENEILRRRHLEMRKEKGEQKHKADMLEQRVILLEKKLACASRNLVIGDSSPWKPYLNE